MCASFLHASSENRFKDHVCKKESCEIVSPSSCANRLLNGIAGTVTWEGAQHVSSQYLLIQW